jgi:hypothetical protein
VRQDLRKECRAASEEQTGQRQEPVKSPKKKLFGIHFPTFGRSPTPTPPMPSKAAQVLGQAPRNPTKVVIRPIVPSGLYTPTKAARSDTARSLPAKLLNQDTHVRSHHTGAARRNRAVSRRSPPRISKQPSIAETSLPAPGLVSSFESGPPPTPPAKDTPPEGRATVQPSSPLRRTAPSDRLRESYSANCSAVAQLRFPAFALSPSPTKLHSPGIADRSPTKHVPSTADDYQRLIAGQPLPWPSPARDDSRPELEDQRTASITRKVEEGQDLDSSYPHLWNAEKYRDQHEQHIRSHDDTASFRLSQPPQFPAAFDRKSEESQYVYSDRGSRHYSPLQPRFYSPSDRSVQKFAEGETPSKNVSAVAPASTLSHLLEVGGAVWRAPASPRLLPPSPSRPTMLLLPYLLSFEQQS